jgi:hypothetical protein
VRIMDGMGRLGFSVRYGSADRKKVPKVGPTTSDFVMRKSKPCLKILTSPPRFLRRERDDGIEFWIRVIVDDDITAKAFKQHPKEIGVLHARTCVVRNSATP